VRWPTRRELLDLGVVGGLLLVGGNGLVAWGEQTVPSGIAALFVGMSPVWMVVVAWLAFRDRPAAVVVVGVLVGFAGVAILAAPDPSSGFGGPGLVALLIAPVLWAAGSVYATRHESRVSPSLLGTGIEMAIAGVLLTIVGIAIGEPATLRAPSLDSVAATAYLVLVGSLIGYTAYAWLLRNAPLPIVSTYAYVNPVVAVLLGAAILAEAIEARTVLAGAVIVVSVALIITVRGRSARGEPREPGEPAELSRAEREASTVERAA
jgi:drug/metabolite transporter (DMT)-like permease